MAEQVGTQGSARLTAHGLVRNNELVVWTSVTCVVPFVLLVWLPVWAVIAWGAVAAFGGVSYSALGRYPDRVRRERILISVAAVLFLIPLAVALTAEPSASLIVGVFGLTVVHIVCQSQFTSYASPTSAAWGARVVGFTGSGVLLVLGQPAIAVLLVVLTLYVSYGALAVHRLIATLGRSRARAEAALQAEEVASAELDYLANHDPLTDLLNRRGLATVLDELSLSGQEVVLAMMDVDHFKMVNDTFGHMAGDRVLTHVASVLSLRLGPAWTLARLGGDEFAAVSAGGDEFPDLVASPISCPASLVRTGDVALKIQLSCGVVEGSALFVPTRLLSEAGHAMRTAKHARRGLVRLDVERRSEFECMLTSWHELQAALQNERIIGHAQPVVSRDTGAVVGLEVLARHLTPDGQIHQPASFIPQFEQHGMTAELGLRMLELAAEFCTRFAGLQNAPFVSVNLSASHLMSADILGAVEGLLFEYDVAPEKLVIEVTETQQIAPGSLWESNVAGLRALGVGVAIDDFGSGYSNLARLSTLDLTHVKLDRSIILHGDGDVGPVIAGVTSFAKQAGLSLIAEGVESERERKIVDRHGIDLVQGFAYHRPMPFNEAESLVHDSCLVDVRELSIQD